MAATGTLRSRPMWTVRRSPAAMNGYSLLRLIAS